MYQTVTHKGKFYMMGSMGCLASLGLAIALEQPEKRVILLDGDGAILMKMGALATVGYHRPGNLIHIWQPTLSTAVNLLDVAEACGYPTVNNVKTIGEFEAIMNNEAKYPKPLFIHIEISPGTEEELTRPPTSPEEMRDCLRAFLQ